MRFIFHLITALAIALYVGFGLSQLALDNGQVLGVLKAGPWTTRPSSGTDQADPYLRADMARSGAMPMGRSEGMVFIARVDSDGRTLSGTCSYRLSGRTPVATLWTLHARDSIQRVVSSSADQAGMNSHQVSRFRDGRFQIKISPELQQGNWLRITPVAEMQLVLTLYDTNIFLGGGSEIGEMPSIERENCL